MNGLYILAIILAGNVGATIYLARNVGRVEGRIRELSKRVDQLSTIEDIRRIIREEMSKLSA